METLSSKRVSSPSRLLIYQQFPGLPIRAEWVVVVVDDIVVRLFLDRYAPQPFEHALGMVYRVTDGICLGSRPVQLRLHQGDEGLAGLVWAVLVNEVVEVDEQISDICHLVLGLLLIRVS